MTRALATLLLPLVVAFARPAEAKPRPVVQVFIAAAPAERTALAQVIRELLEPLAVDVQIAAAARIEQNRVASAPDNASGEAAIAFVDALEPGRSTLYLVDPKRDRVYVRSVRRSRHGEELAREELGHILETAVEGLLVGETIGVPRRTAFPTEAPKPTPRPPAWQPSLELGLLYEAEYLSHQVLLTHGPLLAGGLGLNRGRWRVGLLGTAQYRQPLHAESAFVSARLEAAALRLTATVATEVTTALELRAGLGAGTDIVSVEPQSRDAVRAEAEEPSVLSYGVFRALVGVDFRVSPRISLLAWIAADIDPSDTRYVFSTRRGEETVLNPATVRPAALLGLGFR